MGLASGVLGHSVTITPAESFSFFVLDRSGDRGGLGREQDSSVPPCRRSCRCSAFDDVLPAEAGRFQIGSLRTCEVRSARTCRSDGVESKRSVLFHLGCGPTDGAFSSDQREARRPGCATTAFPATATPGVFCAGFSRVVMSPSSSLTVPVISGPGQAATPGRRCSHRRPSLPCGQSSWLADYR